MSVVSPELTVVFDCALIRNDGIIQLDITLDGAKRDVTVATDTTIVITITLSGSEPQEDILVEADSIEVVLQLKGEAVANRERINWVGWSKIGEANFKLDLINDAGFRPMAWDGYTFRIMQLGYNAVVYGTNGVTAMFPVGAPSPTFGFKELIKGVGVKSKDAIAGNNTVHFFIDKKNQLWTLTEQSIDMLDFSEFLGELTNPLLFYDDFLDRLLISDETHGYVLTKSGMGGGYSNLRGYIRDAGVVSVTSCGSGITRPQPYLITSVMDFGQRGTKTINSVHMSTETPEKFELAYDFRFLQGRDWTETRWVPFNTWGTAFLRCVGMEFRIKIRAIDDILDEPWDAMIDYLHINVHYTDQRFKRGSGATGRPDNREVSGVR